MENIKQMQIPSKAQQQNIPDKRVQRVDSILQPPGKYEVTPENTFSFDLLLKEHKGRWVVADKDVKGVECHTVVFRIWSYDEMIDLRKRSMFYDNMKRTNIMDNDLLNRLKIQKLLSSWTLDRENPRLKLMHVNGVLADESWKAFTKLSPNIAERIINEMNLVLDYGG